MELDLETTYAAHAYPILTALIAPRPIAWVTTLGEDGVVNAAPFSMFNLLGVSPPIVGFGVGNREKGIPKDTAINIARTHEFVINLVDESLVDAMSITADAFPQGISELEKVGATTVPSSLIGTPRIEQAQVSMECTEWGTLNIGNNRVVIGLVKRLHLRDELFDTESKTVRGDRFFPVGHLTGMHCYSRSNGRFDLPHPLPL